MTNTFYTITVGQLMLHFAPGTTPDQTQKAVRIARRHGQSPVIGTRDVAPEQGGLSVERICEVLRIK